MLALLVMLGWAACAAALPDAELFDVPKGAVVRATLVEPRLGSLTTPKSVTGVLVGVTSTSIEIKCDEDDAPRVLPLAGVERIERRAREGCRNHGAMIGAGAGVLAATVFVLVSEAGDDDGEYLDIGAGPAIAIVSMVLAPAGALVGALVSPGARWEPVAMESLQVSVAGGPGGDVRVGMGWKF
jgi:hypothetical protein